MWAKPEPNEHEKWLFSRAQKYAGKLAWIPGIRMVAVCNSLGFYATHQDSDIDLFIVTAPHRIWLVRMLSTVILSLHWVRRRNLNRIKQTKYDLSAHVVGRFCLSFFCTTDALDLSDIAIDDDVYLYFWMRHLHPIIDIDDTYLHFLKANHIDSSELPAGASDFLTVTQASSRWSHARFFDLLNACFRRILLPRAKRSYTRLGSPRGVVIGDDMLKFHDQDRREAFRDWYIQQL